MEYVRDTMDWLMGKGRRKTEKDPPSSDGIPGPPYLDPAVARFPIHFVTPALLPAYVRLPQGVERDEWLATHTISFFEHVNLLYSCLSEYCNVADCSSMNGPQQSQYYWVDEKGKKLKSPASSYVDFVMSFIHKLISDESVFPTKYGNTFPSNFLSLIKRAWRYLFHVIAHMYAAHFSEIRTLQLHPHLHTLFVHFSVFNKEFGLVEEEETRVLDDLLDLLLSEGISGTAASSGSSPVLSTSQSDGAINNRIRVEPSHHGGGGSGGSGGASSLPPPGGATSSPQQQRFGGGGGIVPSPSHFSGPTPSSPSLVDVVEQPHHRSPCLPSTRTTSMTTLTSSHRPDDALSYNIAIDDDDEEQPFVNLPISSDFPVDYHPHRRHDPSSSAAAAAAAAASLASISRTATTLLLPPSTILTTPTTTTNPRSSLTSTSTTAQGAAAAVPLHSSTPPPLSVDNVSSSSSPFTTHRGGNPTTTATTTHHARSLSGGTTSSNKSRSSSGHSHHSAGVGGGGGGLVCSAHSSNNPLLPPSSCGSGPAPPSSYPLINGLFAAATAVPSSTTTTPPHASDADVDVENADDDDKENFSPMMAEFDISADDGVGGGVVLPLVVESMEVTLSEGGPPDSNA